MNPARWRDRVRGSKKKIGRGDRPVCSDQRERRSGDADFVLVGGVRAEPSHPSPTERKMSRATRWMRQRSLPARAETLLGGSGRPRLERDRAKRGAARFGDK